MLKAQKSLLYVVNAVLTYNKRSPCYVEEKIFKIEMLESWTIHCSEKNPTTFIVDDIIGNEKN